MQVVSPELIQGKKVLLRLDLDVPLSKGTGDRLQVTDDFRLKAGLPTLKLCLEFAEQVIVLGHIGRPLGVDKSLSVEPIYDWYKEKLGRVGGLGEVGGKLKILENLRFEEGESFDTAQDKDAVLEYAKELATLGNFYVNEAFAAYHPAASTTVLPTLLPSAAGLRFVREVGKLREVRESPKRPLVIIIGGAKVEDKLPVVEAMAKIADFVLVGGKIVKQQSAVSCQQSANILVGELNEEGNDINPETVEKWKPIIREAKMIVWNGPLGEVEQPKNFQTHEVANLVVSGSGETIVGGGDTISYLGKLGLLGKFGFISTGGGAMLEFLITGTLPSIDSLDKI